MTKKPQSLLLVMSFATVFLSQACSCDPSLGGDECVAPLVDNAGTCCNPPTDEGLCQPGFFCENPIFDPANTATCGVVCEAECIRRELQPGTLSQQLDVTQTASGTVMLSGYSPGDSINSIFYRDLVVGEYDPAADVVNWEIIDGTDPDAIWDGYYAQDGWRDGIIDPGADVGRYSSIVASGEDLIVSYEDTSNRALKVAVRNAGTWTTHTVEDLDGDVEAAGLPSASKLVYTSIALDGAGLPVIAYGIRVPATAADQQPTGWIRIAESAVALPTQASDWTITDLTTTVVNIGCLQGDALCHEDATCVSIGTTGRGHCVPTVGTGDCTETCGSGTVCDNTVCAPTRRLGDLMDAQGLFNNLVRTVDGFALVWYDRSLSSSGGNVWGMRLPDADADWSDNAGFAIEGYNVNPLLHGDCGISASLHVQENDAANAADDIWHVTFVDGSYERLRYVTVNSANLVTGRATVDDGYPGANRPADRPMLGGERRLVGDGASVVVSSDGEVRIGYHDSTRVYPIMARCETGCTSAVPVACVTTANCAGVSATSQCNAGFCSNTNWVSAPAFELPADANASPNAGYYTVQILDVLDTTNSLLVWLERTLQPTVSGNDITEVDRFAPLP